MPTTNPDRLTRCRILGRFNDQCTGEAVDPDGEVLLCTAHLARAWELIQRKIPMARR